MENIKELKEVYKKFKFEIRNRLKEFSEKKDDKEIFAELCFCLLTPQTKAEICWQTIEMLINQNLLFYGTEKQIAENLKKIRFNKKKANYIIEARKEFFRENLKDYIKNTKDIHALRKFLVKKIKGFGMKETSHFLRNIGLGDNIAILDRHILKNLKMYNIIEEIPERLSQKKYLEIEKKFIEFSKKINIKPSELDLLLWAKETGFVFK
ncbi:MAG: N-glycosylase/DNA lyase [Candidatus Omnitrophica bacterium]|nr:N-glycosylase/DNA lyase [Candidatus Omnitrophota bacterium]MCM8801721.1 N-glycosylase/DNA lyase [Candidatus Omnitrophota bacterium]